MLNLTRDRAVGRFLTHRQQLLVHYVKLSSTIDHGQRDVAEVLLHRLCQALVDYLSDGYFRIYGDLLSSQAWPSQREYAAFEATTSLAMAFNDRYGGQPNFRMLTLRPALAELGLALETRFGLEDSLLESSSVQAVG